MTFAAGVANDLPLDNPVDGAGVYLAGTGRFAGMHIYKANDAILATAGRGGQAAASPGNSCTAIRIAGVTRRR